MKESISCWDKYNDTGESTLILDRPDFRQKKIIRRKRRTALWQLSLVPRRTEFPEGRMQNMIEVPEETVLYHNLIYRQIIKVKANFAENNTSSSTAY